MYSMVLMMALSGSADVPALGHHNSCTGCSGCSGYVCSGCSGYVMAECYGGGCTGGKREKHSRKGCHGCSGCSGCSGCTGVVYASCSGCEGCCGGGCCGHQKREKHHKKGCCGCSGSSCYGYSCCGTVSCGCTGSVMYSAPVVGCVGSAPVIVEPAPKKEDKKPETIKEPKGDKEASLFAPATIVVSLPAEAKLAVDGYATTSTSSVRTLTSPALEDGKDYTYTLTAEVVRDGKAVTTSKEITVRAGEAINVALEIPQAVVALK